MDQEILRSSLEVLQRTRSLIEQGWCQGAEARNADDEPVLHHANNAVSWCLIGAFFRASGSVMVLTAYKALCQAARSGLLAYWNDQPHRTKEDVLRVLDRARGILERANA